VGAPYGLELVENCLICKLRSDSFFCGLPKTSLEAFEKIKFTAAYPAGAVLFVEGQSPRGIYMLCKGRVKLSTTSRGALALASSTIKTSKRSRG